MELKESIQTKLRRVILLTSGVILFLSISIFVTYEIIAFRQSHLKSISTIAQILSDNATSSLVFKDKDDAQSFVASLHAEPTIQLAALYDEHGEVLASYPEGVSPARIPAHPGPDRARYEGGMLVIVKPSIQRGRRVGTILLESDLSPLYSRLKLYSAIVFLVLGTSAAVAYLLSGWMQRRVTTPILELASVASEISEKRDFSKRAAKRTQDEIGGLTDAFNEMLAQIGERDNALQQSAERLRMALEGSQTGTWDWNLRSRVLIWDDYLHRLFGMQPGTFPGTYEAFLEKVHAGDRPAVERAIKTALATLKELQVEFRIYWPDGSIRNIIARGSPFVDESREPLRLTGVMLDVTGSRKAEQAVRESEERFRSMADAAPVMIWTASPDTKIDYINNAWVAFTGRDRERELGKGWTELIHPDDRQDVINQFTEAFASRRPLDFNYRLLRADGEYRWIRDIGIPRFAPDGTFRGYIGSCTDFTDVRQAQIDLENRVEARTAELAETNRELEAFTYSVSHDLRAPLRHINAYAQILEEDHSVQLSEDARGYLARIRAGTRNMGMLVDDLLNLARVGRQDLAVQKVNLNELVGNIVAELRQETANRKIEWKVSPLPAAEADPGLIKQVFYNLLSNAVKYSRPREVAVIEVDYLADAEPPCFRIRDNGVGFNMKYASKLFGVFQRLHRTEDFEGTGVGLATVERIVRKHGGRIWAEAELDKGAAFYFTLAGVHKEQV